MSRRMLVSCIATPRSSASRESRSVAPAVAEDREAQPADRAGDRGSSRPARRRSRTRWCRARRARRPRSAARARRAAASSAVARAPARPAPGRAIRAVVVVEPREPSRAARAAPAAAASSVVTVVADVVDPPRERVHGAHRLALGARQQADAVVEVGGLVARDLLALPVGSARSRARGRSSARAADLEHASTRAAARRARPPCTSTSSARPTAGDEPGDRQPRP